TYNASLAAAMFCVTASPAATNSSACATSGFDSFVRNTLKRDALWWDRTNRSSPCTSKPVTSSSTSQNNFHVGAPATSESIGATYAVASFRTPCATTPTTYLAPGND